MYQLLKTSIKFILPNTWFKAWKPQLRKTLAWYYKGNMQQCLICEAKLRTFVLLKNKDLLCPNCGSLPRTRRLYQLLTERNLLKGKIIHFSPPLSLYKKLKQQKGITYISSDFENEFIAAENYDLTQISVADQSFDLFIAYHVLEHIEEDTKAMQELFRITKKGGKGLLQTPFKEGAIYENPAIQSSEERLVHFGQEDHVRIYSVEGLINRLENVGFKVKCLEFAATKINYWGFKTKEVVLFLEK